MAEKKCHQPRLDERKPLKKHGSHKGRLFKKGNPGGPGRPKRATEKTYLEAMIGGCPLDKWRRIIKAAIADALLGDKDARNWLSKYLIGEETIAVLGKDQSFDLGVLVPAGYVPAPKPSPPIPPTPGKSDDPVPPRS